MLAGAQRTGSMDMIPAGMGVGAPGQQMGSPGVGPRILVRAAEMLQLTTLLREAAARERTLAAKIRSLEVRACRTLLLAATFCLRLCLYSLLICLMLIREHLLRAALASYLLKSKYVYK